MIICVYVTIVQCRLVGETENRWPNARNLAIPHAKLFPTVLRNAENARFRTWSS
jgi:hypothetical protein